MKILVTGGAGFIGSHLIEHHLNKKDKLIAIDDLSTGDIKNIKPFLKNSHFTFHEKKINDWDELSDCIKSVDRIYHLAAVVGMFNVINHPVETLDVNLLSTCKILSLVSEQKKKPLVFIASSSEVYGSKCGSMHENDSLKIETIEKNHVSYPVSKLCNELYALSYNKTRNVPVVIGRIFNTIGPRQSDRYGMVVPRFVKQALKNKPITIFSDGGQTRTFCDVRDTVNAIDILANNPESIGKIINIGSQQEISIKNLALLVRKVTNSNSELKFISYIDAYGKEYQDIKHRMPDLTRFNHLTGGFHYQWDLKRTIDDVANEIINLGYI